MRATARERMLLVVGVAAGAVVGWLARPEPPPALPHPTPAMPVEKENAAPPWEHSGKIAVL